MNQSLYIDNSSIDLGKKFLDINNTLTFSFLLKLPEYGADMTLLAQNSDGSATYRTHIIIRQSGKLSVFIGNISPETVDGINVIPLNKWVNISVVLYKTNLKIYVDGVLDLEREVLNYYNDNTWLFAYQRGTKYFLKAYVDDFKIYDYAMTQEEILKKINKLEHDYTRLLRYYKFDEIIESNKIKDYGNDSYDIIVNGIKYLSKDIPDYYKYLIKRNNEYYSIKPEFYKNINYNPLTLYGDAKPNLTDFQQFGFNDLISMKESISTKMLKGKDLGVLGSGKYFEIELDSGCTKILSQPNILAEVEVTNSAWTNPMTMPLKVSKYQTVSFLLKDDNYSRFEFRSTYGGLYGTYVTYYSDGSSVSNSDGSQELNDGTWNYTFKNMKLDETKMCNKINIQAGPRDDTSFVLFKIYKYYKLRYLIQYNSQLYTFDGNGLVLSESQVLDENNFIANGFSNVTLITEDMWNNRFPLKIGVKLLAYTDKIDVTNFDINCSLTPFKPIDKFNKFNIMIKK